VVVMKMEEIRESFYSQKDLGSEYVKLESDTPFYRHPEANCIDIEFPTKPERLVFLARTIARIGYDESDFRGALLWFSDWAVWNALDQAVGYRVVEAMHAAAGQPRAFEVGLGHHFRADELQETIAMLLQPMIFGWNADYVPSWSYGESTQFFVHLSHDSFASVVTCTKKFYDKAFRFLEEAELCPKPGHQQQGRRFCRTS
jgi:hypothetical protein